jgi:hypothetical protein
MSATFLFSSSVNALASNIRDGNERTVVAAKAVRQREYFILKIASRSPDQSKFGLRGEDPNEKFNVYLYQKEVFALSLR